MKYHSVHAYKSFESVMFKVAAYLSDAELSCLGHSNASVHKRLVQAIAENCFFDFIKQTTERVELGGKPDLDVQSRISCSGLTIDISGGVAMKAKKYLNCIRWFLVHWVHVLIYSFPKTGKDGDSNERISILFGPGRESLHQNI